MKNIRTIKIMAFAVALCISASMLAGCANKNPDEQGGADQSVTQTESAVTTVPNETQSEEEIMATLETDVMYDTRGVAEGDVYAINKFTVDPLPANYVLAQESQEAQGKLYLNGVSKITVMATNYKEDFQELSVALETACVGMKMNNMLFASDTDFEDVKEITVDGFEALSRDFTITANEFIKENPEDEGDGVKTPVAWFKGRIVYFFSEKDVFYCIFETDKDSFDETIKGFEEFVANIKIDENAQNKTTEAASEPVSASEESSVEEAVTEAAAE